MRWFVVAAALEHLRAARRHSLRIIDAECGDGRLLIQAARHARALGFTAIEARGIDPPAAIAAARHAAGIVRDPAVGFDFDLGEPLAALLSEIECPADILLWRGDAGARPDVAGAAEAAGRLVVGGAPARRIAA